MAIQVAHMGTSKVIRLKGAPAKAVVAPSSWSHAKRSASGRKSGRHRGGTARGCQSLRRGEHLQFCRGPGGAGYRYRYSYTSTVPLPDTCLL